MICGLGGAGVIGVTSRDPPGVTSSDTPYLGASDVALQGQLPRQESGNEQGEHDDPQAKLPATEGLNWRGVIRRGERAHLGRGPSERQLWERDWLGLRLAKCLVAKC